MTLSAFYQMIDCLKRGNLDVSGFFLSKQDYEELYISILVTIGVYRATSTTDPYIPPRFYFRGYRVEPTHEKGPHAEPKRLREMQRDPADPLRS